MTRIAKKAARKTTIWVMIPFCTVVLVVAFSQPATTAETSDSQKQNALIRPTENPRITIGKYPPDFELPILTFGKDASGKPAGIISEKDTIRLSSFRGKKPVFLVMSSYT